MLDAWCRERSNFLSQEWCFVNKHTPAVFNFSVSTCLVHWLPEMQTYLTFSLFGFSLLSRRLCLYGRCLKLDLGRRCCLSVYLCLTFSRSQLFDFMCVCLMTGCVFKEGMCKKTKHKLWQVGKAHFALHNHSRRSHVCSLCALWRQVMVNLSVNPRRWRFKGSMEGLLGITHAAYLNNSINMKMRHALLQLIGCR